MADLGDGQKLISKLNSNPNANGLFGIAALMLALQQYRAEITAKSHYDYYQLTTHNSSEKNN